MATLVIDPKAIAKLLQMRERVQLVDKSGKTLGYYDPPISVLFPDDITDEELDRREKEPGGMTTPEAIAFLKEQRRKK